MIRLVSLRFVFVFTIQPTPICSSTRADISTILLHNFFCCLTLNSVHKFFFLALRRFLHMVIFFVLFYSSGEL
ncbi:hypothetical protein BS17DRAFT_500012 [Gyrodon lividus]|nr:hypothetical protein BS17DRAFT_500012 [Gyrodon lividus]